MASISSWDCTFDSINPEPFQVPSPEFDDTLLMDLLEETGATDCTDDDRLGFVMRSLETELEGEREGCMDCGMEDLLSDLDDCSRFVAYNAAEDPFDWVATGAAGGWYDVEEDIMIGYGDLRDYNVVGEYPEQECISLWQ